MKVPTPGPYSTNSRVFAQSTGLQHLVDQDPARRDDRSDHHRILQEAAQELPLRDLAPRRSRRRVRRCGPLSVRAVEIGIEAPAGGQEAESVGKWAARLASSNASGPAVGDRLRTARFARRRGSAARDALNAASWPPSHAIAASARRALTTPHFLLLYAAMLVAAAGNTALQSVMPAIGREIGIADFWVAIAYTWSAVLWVLLAPYWAEKSDHHGRKALTLMGVGGFIVSMLLCGVGACSPGCSGWIGGALTFGLFAMFRAIYGGARLRDAVGDPGLSRFARPGAAAGSRRCRRCRPRSASARSSARRSRRCSCCRSSASPGRCSPSRRSRIAVVRRDPAVAARRPSAAGKRRPRRGDELSLARHAADRRKRRRGDRAARRTRLKWNDPRIRRWIVAGVVAGHAQAAMLTCLGFFVIDRLHLTPPGRKGRSRS